MISTFKKRKYIVMPLLVGLGCVLPSLTLAQSAASCGANNDVRIEKDKPTVYLTFERFGKALDASKQRLLQEDQGGDSKQKGSDVWLRLHNNTCWPISLEQFSMYLPKQQPNEGPGERFKRMGVLDDGAETGLYYMVMKDGSRIGYSGIDVSAYVKLLPGRTTLFSVDRAALQDKQYIRVFFVFDWEFQRGSERKAYTNNEPDHYVEFSSYDLKGQSKK